LILGGALGNAADRIARGYVVDYLDVYWGDWHWPACGRRHHLRRGVAGGGRHSRQRREGPCVNTRRCIRQRRPWRLLWRAVFADLGDTLLVVFNGTRLLRSLDGKSVKYEHVYLHAYESVAEARQQLTSYFTFYNTRRPHSSLGGMTPDTAYFGNLATKSAAERSPGTYHHPTPPQTIACSAFYEVAISAKPQYFEFRPHLNGNSTRHRRQSTTAGTSLKKPEILS
jgi:hypothetical protein